jgi:hypothetical protein
VSRKIVTIGQEVFDFLAWKVPRHSFYARRSDGELRVVILIGSALPPWATRFRCEFGDGTAVPFNSYELLPLSLSEVSQLENVLQGSFDSRKGRPLAAGNRGKPGLSAKRATLVELRDGPVDARTVRAKDILDGAFRKKEVTSPDPGGG